MNEHYYTRKPTSKLVKRTINAVLRGNELTLTTGSGTFSPTKIDLGTKLLIESAQLKEGQSILDLGCGYGAVGIALAKDCPSCNVVMTDVNERAVELAKENSKQNKVNAKTVSGDAYEAVKDEMFDSIYLNPPQTAGKEVCIRMIKEAKAHLNKGGKLFLVARHKKGGATLAEFMKETFGNCETITIESGFRVYNSTMPS